MSQTLAFVERFFGFGNQTDGAVPRQGGEGRTRRTNYAGNTTHLMNMESVAD